MEDSLNTLLLNAAQSGRTLEHFSLKDLAIYFSTVTLAITSLFLAFKNRENINLLTKGSLKIPNVIMYI